jgi:site-specific DNA recombinase
MDDRRVRPAIYARVSSEQQAQQNTIASQVAALRERVQADALVLDEELCFIDDGYSGSTLQRPALERLRDVAYAGGFERLYVLAPDRLARKYAYQVLLLEEFQGAGVELAFLNQKLGGSAEEDLCLQMQGMLAEYERARILERSRRGKRHAARRGLVNVLSGAPYGYSYVRKHEGEGQASYQVVFEEARVVRQVFEWIGRDRLSIGEVCRRLQQQGVVTRTGKLHWDRSTIWGMLQNPAYVGSAAFGKTRAGELRPRLRPPRGRSAQPRRARSTYDTTPEERLPIAVPAIVSEELFAAVAEQLVENRRHNRQRSRGARHLLQGLVQCGHCGYAYYGKRVSRSAAKGRIPYAYYRCVGTDAYRFGGKRVCANTQVRTDMLDQAVWNDVGALLRDPAQVQMEYERRLQRPKKDHDPSRQRDKQLGNLRRTISRLIDAYEDGLIDKREFEPRVAKAKERLARLQAEAKAVAEHEAQQAELRLVIGCLEEFAQRVQQGLETSDWTARRDIIRALVKTVKIEDGAVRISYRISPRPFDGGPAGGPSLPHCWRREHGALGSSFLRNPLGQSVHHALVQKHLHQPQYPAVRNLFAQPRRQAIFGDRVEVTLQVRVHDIHLAFAQQGLDPLQSMMTAPSVSKAVAVFGKCVVEDRFQNVQQGCLHHAVAHGRYSQRSQFLASRLGNPGPADRLRAVVIRPQSFFQPLQLLQVVFLKVRHGLVVHARRSLVGQHVIAGRRQVERRDDFVNQRVPSSSAHSIMECCQHAVCPDDTVRPLCNRWRLSGRCSRERHCYRFWFRALGHSTFTSLRPFAPPELPGFIATMDALTPAGPALRTRVAARGGITAHERLPGRTAGIPVSSRDNFWPFRLQAPPAVPMRYLGFPDHRAYRRYRLADDPHPHGSCVIWASPLFCRLATAAGRIEFAAAGFSQPVLRTGHSPPVALHLASRRRSYLRLRGARRTPTRTFTLQMSQTYRRT